MKIFVSGKNIDIGQALHAAVEEKAKAIAEKYSLNPIECTVIISKDRYLIRCQIDLHLGRGVNVRTVNDGNEAYACVEQAFHSLENRLRRYKKRLVDHQKKRDTDFTKTPAQQYVIEPHQEDLTNGDNPLIIAELKTHIPSLNLSEAVMHMDLSESPAILFHNSTQKGTLNVIYRRPDGNIGWIAPTPHNGEEK